MKVLSERETLELAISGRSLARIGEGELRLAYGKPCISQVADERLKVEMRRTLSIPPEHPCLPCVPRVFAGIPNGVYWRRFDRGIFLSYMTRDLYGSAFITRPDVVTDIDRPEYWERCRDLWRGKDVTLVIGSDRSLRDSFMTEARSVRTVWGPRRDAYARIDEIEEQIGKPSGPVLLCLGATATILAERLARKGLHAVDLGHLGYFMAKAGVFSHSMADVISDEYLALQRELHSRPEGYGGSSGRHAKDVIEFANKLRAELVLDYGCGQGRLRKGMEKLGLGKLRVHEYDPAIEGKDKRPKPADLVVCTDVLEHIEPDKLGFVLAHIWRLSIKGAFLVIAIRPANKIMADGRNAHLIVESVPWWIDKLTRCGWKPGDFQDVTTVPGHDVRILLRKGKA